MGSLRVLLGTLMIVSSFHAVADASNHGDNSISIGTGGVYLRKDLNEATQIFTSAFLANDNNFSSSGNRNTYSITLGLVRHLYTNQISDQFTTYIDAALAAGYRRDFRTGSLRYTYTEKTYAVGSAYVLEYFLAPKLSIMGSVGLELRYINTSISDPWINTSQTLRHIVFPTSSTALRYYW